MPTTSDALIRILARLLRHKADTLLVDSEGWASLEQVAQSVNSHGRDLGLWSPPSAADIARFVQTPSQQDRFEIRGNLVRARYGHSIPHVVSGIPRAPPTHLIHATSSSLSESIRRNGLLPGDRCFVHLTTDEDYALDVASILNDPLLLGICAGEAFANGVEFLQASRRVWLARRIPAQFIDFNVPSIIGSSSH